MSDKKKTISLEEFFKIYCRILDEWSKNSGEALREYWDKMKKLSEAEKGISNG